MIPKRTIEQVTETANANIDKVIGEYVTLRRSGSGMKGCCPFHNEKTPSFNVNTAKGFFKCFGCGKSGDAVKFLQEYEKIEWLDAIKRLGARFGIEVRDEKQTPEQEQRDRDREAMQTLMEYAARAYTANLKESAEGQADGLARLRAQGLRDDTIETFRLGYAAKAPDGLTAKALADGYKKTDLVKCGLTQEDGGTDSFQGRIVAPVLSSSGKVLAFSAQTTDGADFTAPPETELYHQSDTVFGIFQARAEISRKDKCYVADGVADAVRLHQSGIANAVAAPVSSLTVRQIESIKRYTSNVAVIVSGEVTDTRGADLLLHEGMSVRVLPLPNGESAASFARSHTAEEVQQYAEEHERDFIIFRAESLMAGCADDIGKRAQALKSLATSLAEVSDVVRREILIQGCARIMGLSESDIAKALQHREDEIAVEQAREDESTRELRRQQAIEEGEKRAQAEAMALIPLQPAPESLPADIAPADIDMLNCRRDVIDSLFDPGEAMPQLALAPDEYDPEDIEEEPIPEPIARRVTRAATAGIGQVIGSYVALTPKGAILIGKCPFHNSNALTLTVDTEKGFYYCSGCHDGGSAVGFVMKRERKSMPDALRIVGRSMGISVPNKKKRLRPGSRAAHLNGLYVAMEYAARTYEHDLSQTADGQAYGQPYFKSRGFTDQTVATFRLGYSLKNGFTAKALADGIGEEELTGNGLTKVNPDTGEKYDYFRGRVMFPIQDVRGRVIAFGARVLDARTKGVSLKYLNSPETELYKKTEIVYGIYQAKDAIRQRDKCFLVEGYTDVISMHQSGVANVVASSGTALTEQQIRLIKGYTRNITVLYDGDAAGIHASLRGIDMILREGMSVRVLLLPDGDDPDSFARKHSADEFQLYVESHETDFINYQAETLMADCADDPDKKSKATHTIVASIAEVQDAGARQLYAAKCAGIMGLSQETIEKALKQKMRENAAEAQRQARAVEHQARRRAAEQPQPYTRSTPPDGFPPDLSPSEMAMLQGGHMGGGRTPQPAPPQGRPLPAEVEMREILRYLVTYTQSKIHVREGETETEMTVGDYIVNMLDADGLAPQDPALRQILDDYRAAPDRTVVDRTYYLNHPNPKVASFVAVALGGRPALSKIHSRYSPVEKEEDSLDEFVPRAVQELQMKEVMAMIDRAMADLSRLVDSGAADEEVTRQMEEIRNLNAVKKELSLLMGERAIVRMRVGPQAT